MTDRRMDRDFEGDVVRYPDPAWEPRDSRFGQYMLGSAALVFWQVEALALRGVVLAILSCVALYVLSRPHTVAESSLRQ